MKIQLDTENKTIRVENKVNFKELIEILEKLLPKKEWHNFDLETNVTINNWTNPIYIRKWPPPYYPWYCENNITLLNSGTYNVEC